MATLLEYVGNIHVFLGPYRGNPIALYLKKGANGCEIAPRAYPWSDIVGKGETPNRAAADFEEKWKANGLSAEMYTGPAWEGGIKPERPKPAAPPKPPAGTGAAAPAKSPATPSGDAGAATPSGAPSGTNRPTSPTAPPVPPTTGTMAPAQPQQGPPSTPAAPDAEPANPSSSASGSTTPAPAGSDTQR